MFGAHTRQLLIAHVGDLHILCGFVCPRVDDANNGAVQTNANWGIFLVEAAIVSSRRYDIFHGIARNRLRDQRSNQQASDGSIPVWKVEDVGFFLFRIIAEIHAGKTGIAVAAVIVWRLIARECRYCIDPDGEEIVGVALKKF